MISFLFSVILATLAIIIASKLHFFYLNWKVPGRNPIRFSYVLLGYLIYIAPSIFLPWLFFLILKPPLKILVVFNGVSFLIVVALSILFFYFLLRLMPVEAVRKATLGPERSTKIQLQNLGFGALSYLVAFPVSAFASSVILLLTRFIFPNYEKQEQVAILHLKMLSDYPLILGLTIVGFAIIVPIIEEFLFRGLLQSWLRNHFSRFSSIVITSILFGFFHFSKIQGLDNIDLIFTLSVLGFFLGFIYEKRASLLAPIGLHAIFNSISVVRILMEMFK